VDVMRGAPGFDGTAHTNTLPIFFASMLGIASQAVRATATAQSTQGNAAECPTPWAVADKWDDEDNLPPSTDPVNWDQSDTFTLGTDIYNAPLVGEPGPPTGFTLALDKGYQLALKDSDPTDPWSAGWSRIIEFGPNGGNVLPELIAGCPAWLPQVGLYAGQPCENKTHTDEPRGCINVKTGTVQGPNRAGVEDLIAQDDTAYYNEATKEVVSAKGVSPRIRPVVLFDPESYVEDELGGCGGDNCMIKVTNIFGFFVEGFCDDLLKDGKLEPYVDCGKFENKTIVGRMMKLAGQKRGGSGQGTAGSSFSQVIRLVR
jgi:hypothetical protein